MAENRFYTDGIPPSELNGLSKKNLLRMSNLSTTYTNAQLQSELNRLQKTINKRTLKNKIFYAVGSKGVNTNKQEIKQLKNEVERRKTRKATMNKQKAYANAVNPKTNANLRKKLNELEAKKDQIGLLNWEQKMLNDLTYVTRNNDPIKRGSNVSVLTTSSDPGVGGRRRYRKRFTRRR
jgi:hypothetical protein